MTRYKVGDGGNHIEIANTWRVLDVGSGQAPHPRADVLLEKYLEDDRHRSGDGVDRSDPRLVIGDAQAMPFADASFDYIIASHIAEHVDDPVALARELSRVGRAGYLETPGWLADILLREEFHIWRVHRRGDRLEFECVKNKRPVPVISDVFYAALYACVPREGHWTPNPSNRVLRLGLRAIQRALGLAIRLPLIRPRFYMALEWKGRIEVSVRDGGRTV